MKVEWRAEHMRGLSQMWHDGEGTNGCASCGLTWKRRDRYVYWPIRLGWRWREYRSGPWRWRLNRHGWQIGWDGPDARVFGWTLHVGPLLVKFGPSLRRRKP